MYQLSPSILAADFSRLGADVAAVGNAGAHMIHLDVMDGAFVPSISFGAPVIKALRSYTDKVFDVHLMVQEPVRFLQDFVDAGADSITVHAESCLHLDRTLQQIRNAGKKTGVALNPATPLCMIEPILGEVDMVLLMSVNPGFGGQKYISYVTDKIRELRRTLNERGLSTDIQVDGGVTLDNVEELIRAGANNFVAGSAVYRGDAKANVRAFYDIFKKQETK